MLKSAFGLDYINSYWPLITGASLEKELDFVSSYLTPQTSLLDLCCGHGRHTIPLSTHVSKTVGIDFNGDAIHLARQMSENFSNLTFIEDDILDASIGSASFDVVLMMCNSLGMFSSNENIVFTKVAEALTPGGTFIFDITNRDFQLRHKHCDFWAETDNGRILQKRKFNMETSELTLSEIRISNFGEESHHDIVVRLYALHEILNATKSAGFSSVLCYDGFSDKSYHDRSEHFVFVCQK